MKTLSKRTVIKWKWAWRMGRVRFTITRPSDGKAFKRFYVDDIYLLWAPNRQRMFTNVTDRWIYFNVRGIEYKTPL